MKSSTNELVAGAEAEVPEAVGMAGEVDVVVVVGVEEEVFEPVVWDEPVIKDAAVAHPTIQVNVRNDGGSWCEFKYDTKERYIAAHCKHPDHGPHCRLSRTVKINLNNPNQGRPAGLELAWLFNSA